VGGGEEGGAYSGKSGVHIAEKVVQNTCNQCQFQRIPFRGKGWRGRKGPRRGLGNAIRGVFEPIFIGPADRDRSSKIQRERKFAGREVRAKEGGGCPARAKKAKTKLRKS